MGHLSEERDGPVIGHQALVTRLEDRGDVRRFPVRREMPS